MSAIIIPFVLVAASVASADDHASPGIHRLHAAGLVGETHNSERNGVTFGGDVELRLSRVIGIGLTGEHVDEPFRENVWVAPVLIHPTRALRLSVGPGVERASHRAEHGGVEQFVLLRAGASYGFEVGSGWTIDPELAIDFVEGERVFVYTVSIGRGFGRHLADGRRATGARPAEPVRH